MAGSLTLRFFRFEAAAVSRSATRVKRDLGELGVAAKSPRAPQVFSRQLDLTHGEAVEALRT